MTEPWTIPELNLISILAEICTIDEIYRVLEGLGYQRSVRAISDKSRRLGFRFRDLGVPDLSKEDEKTRDIIQQVLKGREERLTLITPKSIHTSGQIGATNAKVQKVQEALLRDLQEIRDSIPRKGSLSLKVARSSKQSLCIVMSDFHIGRKQLGLEGEETYNIEIGLNRILSTPTKIREALGNVSLDKFDEGVLLLVGDHIDGEGIFGGQEMMLETHVSEQVKRVTKAIWSTIKGLQEMFPLLRIVTTRGNHGRSGASPEANWDNLFFQQLELLVDTTGDSNLTIKNRYGSHNIFEVKGWKGLIRHKAPPSADTPSARAQYGGWYGIHKCDFFVIAHCHHWGINTWNGKPIFRNGSIIGPDDYSETLAVADSPTQVIFGVNNSELPTFVYPIRYQ